MRAGSLTLRAQAILVVIGDAMNFASFMIASMILSRVIPPDDMGTYRQILYLGPMVAALAEMGLSGSIYRFWRALEREQRSNFGMMMISGLIIMGVLSTLIFMLLAAPLAVAYNNPALEKAMVVTAIFPFATIFAMIMRPILLSEGYALRATLFDLVLSLSTIVAIVVPFLLGGTLIQALIVFSFTLLLRFPITIFLARRYFTFRYNFWDRKLAHEIWAYIWPIQVGKLPGMVLGYFDKIVVSLLVSPQVFAIYSLGARELPFVNNIGGSISNVMIPQMVQEFQEKRIEAICTLWRSACEKTALIVYPFGVFSIIYAEPIVKVLFSARYSESSVPFRIFALLIFFRVVEYASIAKALGRSNLILKSSALAALVLIASAFPLVAWMGANGMAWATVLGTLAAIINYLYRYRNLLDAPLNDYFPFFRLLWIAVLAFGSGLLGYGTQLILGLPFDADSTLGLVLMLIRTAIASAIIYLGLLLIFERPMVLYFAHIGRRIKARS